MSASGDTGRAPRGARAARRTCRGERLAWLVALIALLAAVTAAGASSAPSTTIVGNATAGKPLFVTNCGTCHTLKAAGSAGTIGPNLNTVTLTETTIIDAIDNGGASVMSAAEVSKYQTQMPGYKGTLSASQIDDIAAFVYTSTHATTTTTTPTKPAAPKLTGFTPQTGKPGTKVTLTGTNFTGATAVKFGTLKSTFKVVSATKITLTVPSNAKTGKISVTTKAGTATSAKSFTVS